MANRRVTSRLIVTAIMLVAGAAGAITVWRQGGAWAGTPKPAVSKVKPAPVIQEVSALGKIQARKIVSIPVSSEGTLDRFLVDVGEQIYQGQLLAQISSSKLQTAQDQANADLEKARSRMTSLESSLIAARLEASRARADAVRAKGDYDRAARAFARQQMLMREGATPRMAFEKSQHEEQNGKADFDSLDELAKKAEGRVDSLTKELDWAKTRLAEKTKALEEASADLGAGDVHSPVDGVVVARRGLPGDPVNRAVTDLFLIGTDLSDLEVMVAPSGPGALKVRTGQMALVQVAEVAEPIHGTVREVKDGQVFVEFASPSPAIKPGLTAQVKIKLT